jgi:hypothetical protein
MEAGVPAAAGAADMVADRVQAEGTELVGDVELLAVVIGGRDADHVASLRRGHLVNQVARRDLATRIVVSKLSGNPYRYAMPANVGDLALA